MKAFVSVLFIAVFFSPIYWLPKAANGSDTAKVGKPDTPKEAKKDIEGYYVCSGKEPSGKAYNGIAVISRAGEGYVVQWTLGSSSFIGIGFKTGDTLSVGWAMDGKNPPPRGVNVYQIKSTTLEGRWLALPSNGVLAKETLKFLRPLEKDEDDDGTK